MRSENVTLAPRSYASQGLTLPERGPLSPALSPRRGEGEDVPTVPRGRVALRYEPENLSSTATAASVQSAIRAAEAGETRQLFGLYRDLSVSGSHVYAELSKRKLAMLGQSHAVIPADKENAEDVAAAEAIERMIGDCENWADGLGHLLDAVIWPVAVVEKIFSAADPSPRPSPLGGAREKTAGAQALRFTLKRFSVVNPTLLCFRQPYGGLNGPTARGPLTPALSPQRGEGEEQWEPDLRFYATDAEGRIVWNFDEAYLAEPMRHVVYRGHLLAGVRDNWGGPMRAILFWWLLGVLGRDWFGRYMERFGAPWPVAKTDTSNAESIKFLRESLSLSTKVGALIVDHDTAIDLEAALTADGADAYERFLQVCNKEISKVIVGQTLSAEAQSTGLGSAVGKLQAEVREDLRMFDQMKLGETLRRQLFEPFLRINGLRGRAPKIIWGGQSAEDAKAFADVLKGLSDAGLEPTDESLPGISEKIGFEVQRKVHTDLTDPSPRPSPLGGAREKMLSAGDVPLVVHPSDGIAARKAAVLGAAYRGSLAPVRTIILESGSEEEALRRMKGFFSDWRPEKVLAVTEEALQLCAAAGTEISQKDAKGAK